eukprot:7381534-Prymnesium_polylepis.1
MAKSPSCPMHGAHALMLTPGCNISAIAQVEGCRQRGQVLSAVRTAFGRFRREAPNAMPQTERRHAPFAHTRLMGRGGCSRRRPFGTAPDRQPAPAAGHGTAQVAAHRAARQPQLCLRRR